VYGKILTDELLKQKLTMLRSSESKIVFTNGCFDILHRGHLECLVAAKSMGDVLVVGINDDQSVKKLKGENRPVNNLEDRASMLSALQCVDYVIAFSEDTPEKLINKISPSILVKGGDYTINTVVGSAHVRSYGGEVIILPYKNGYSTTQIIEKLKI